MGKLSVFKSIQSVNEIHMSLFLYPLIYVMALDNNRILGIRMRKGLTHTVWWYFHSCAVLNFTDGMSSVNHSLAGDELSCFSILLSQVLSAFFHQSESVSNLSLSLSALYDPENDPCMVSTSTWSICIDLACTLTSSYPSSFL